MLKYIQIYKSNYIDYHTTKKSGGGTQRGGSDIFFANPASDTSRKGSFGYAPKSPTAGWGGGGGGGWYGGSNGHGMPGGGGSGYVAAAYIYAGNVHYIYNGATIAGSQDIPEYPKQDEGNGYARITYYGEDAATLKGLTFLYGFTGSVQDFEILKDGTYKIEAWGAQGGEFASTGQYAGKGGYASGFISYTEDEFNSLKNSADNHLYLYVSFSVF